MPRFQYSDYGLLIALFALRASARGVCATAQAHCHRIQIGLQGQRPAGDSKGRAAPCRCPRRATRRVRNCHLARMNTPPAQGNPQGLRSKRTPQTNTPPAQGNPQGLRSKRTPQTNTPPAQGTTYRVNRIRHTFTSASNTIFRDIFDLPTRRSGNIIGISPTRKPRCTAR